MKTYFIADTHFDHYNVIKFMKRPFESVEEMNRYMMSRWNKRVTEEDLVYILGDFWFQGGVYNKKTGKGKEEVEQRVLELLRTLKGRKYLLEGNHDWVWLDNEEIRAEFEGISSLKDINVDGHRIVLCHYPMLEWNGYFRGFIHLHGHVHRNTETHYREISKLECMDKMYNCGAELLGFQPKTVHEIIKINERFRQSTKRYGKKKDSTKE